MWPTVMHTIMTKWLLFILIYIVNVKLMLHKLFYLHLLNQLFREDFYSIVMKTPVSNCT